MKEHQLTGALEGLDKALSKLSTEELVVVLALTANEMEHRKKLLSIGAEAIEEIKIILDRALNPEE